MSKSVSRRLSDLFIRFTGYTYSNMARLFMRLFVGVMFLQFGIRHLVNFDSLRYVFPSVLGIPSEASLIIMICVELICSLCIMVGFLTRLSCIPPILVMIAAEYYIVHDMLGSIPLDGIDSTDPGYLPIMFIGIYLFLLLAGPGKISLDYFFSLYLIERDNRDERTELEEV
ncbi:MAG: DoxX family protein [Clostridium sp.]|nr:DoxX family protein [Clostridium sp.]